MEQAVNEQQVEEAIGSNQTEAIQEQSISVKTDEDKVNKIASRMVQAVIKNNPNITLEQQEEFLERTKRQVTVERQQVLNILAEAEQEVTTLKWSDVQPRAVSEQSTIRTSGNHRQKTLNGFKGFRGLFYISFGNFVLNKHNGWTYRPTSQQMQNLVKRFTKKNPCEREANHLRALLKPMKVMTLEGEREVETEKMKQLRKDLLDQINEMRGNL